MKLPITGARRQEIEATLLVAILLLAMMAL
jgi:hypothetical protein